ncbi:MAG: DNA-binding NtrC family response regulator [Candidatus Latescibacterota bacterium]|jgi:DNA-binding NtrC family response regulator
MVQMERAKILIIDDEPGLRALLRLELGDIYTHVDEADSSEIALQMVQNDFYDLVIVDLYLPGGDGISFVKTLSRETPNTGAIVMTGRGTPSVIRKAIEAGAVDFLVKPIAEGYLQLIVKKALRFLEENRKVRDIKNQVNMASTFEGMVGVSQPMLRLYEQIRKVAKADASVLVEGETGTGKELIAHAIHNLGPRREMPFVAVNCGALSESLLESELFGHEKGAFTGALKTRKGLIEQAHQGTLFLDEVEAMSSTFQMRLLRALQEKEVARLGGVGTVQLDFRLIAATNVDLKAMVQNDLFREDLYFRFAVVNLVAPPLRHRMQDIPLLIKKKISEVCIQTGKDSPEFMAEVLMLFNGYHWPGNVRELLNLVERIVVMADHSVVSVIDLPDDIFQELQSNTIGDQNRAHLTNNPTLREAREQFEISYLMWALKQGGNNITVAAKIAGIHRRHFHKKISDYNIDASKLTKKPRNTPFQSSI